MKRKLLFPLIICGTFLVACTDEEVVKNVGNTIQEAQLSKQEENLLKAANGEFLYIYDYSVNDQGGQLKLWIEKYEYGKLTDLKSGSIGTDLMEDGQLLVTLREIPESQNAIVTMAIVNGSGYTSGEGLLELPKINSSVSGSVVKEEVALSDDMVLGQISYSDENSSYSANWGELYDKPTDLANELKDFPVVYFIRGSFSEAEVQDSTSN